MIYIKPIAEVLQRRDSELGFPPQKRVHAITIKKYPDGKKTYEVDKLRSDVGGDRKWDDKMYWLPIPKSEMDKNPNLVQNPGYNK